MIDHNRHGRRIRLQQTVCKDVRENIGSQETGIRNVSEATIRSERQLAVRWSREQGNIERVLIGVQVISSTPSVDSTLKL